MKKYDFYVADTAEIPHAGVHVTGDTSKVIAMFMIGILTMDQAATLAMELASRLSADGHDK